MKNITALMILDGFGYSEKEDGNAVKAASTPKLDALFAKYPFTTLGASGESVGLPEGQMGNSEVGHLNIGAGRIIYQDLTRITKAIREKTFFENEVLIKAADNAAAKGSALHIFGLLSDGGVHSHIDHLKAVVELAASRGLKEVYLHCFLDGRDVPPRCAQTYIDDIEAHLKNLGVGKISTVSGRYYAMDRDTRWERVKVAYDAIACGIGKHAAAAADALKEAYERGENDEFVLPTVIDFDGRSGADGCVRSGDSIIMFNFRPDRAREITRAFTEEGFDGFEIKDAPTDIYYVTMTQYDASFENVHIAFPPEHYANTLGEYLAACGKTQVRIAETEKYAHVTFFFNGGIEEPNENEDRILIPSPKVATYDLQPEMSAPEVTKAALDALKSDKYDVLIMNFANADMVGHTGIFDAAVKAVEALDECASQIISYIVEHGGNILVTADHGNADVMLDDNGNVVTAHSTNPVPAVLITPQENNYKLRSDGILADIAPTLLQLMNLEKPAEMTGKSLIL